MRPRVVVLVVAALASLPGFAGRALAHHGLDEPAGAHREQARDKSAAKSRGHRPHGTKVVIEVFQVALLDQERLCYLRRIAVLGDRNPDAVVVELLGQGQGKTQFLAGQPSIIHSTSWRHEGAGTIVLTYLAYAEELLPSAHSHENAHTLLVSELPGVGATHPDKPRPPELRHDDVLAHGLRHLSFLARRKGGEAFVARLGERSRRFLGGLEPELAGRIGGSTPGSNPGAPPERTAR